MSSERRASTASSQFRAFSSHVLRLLKEFLLIRELHHTVQAKVPDIVSYLKCEKDTVIFREGELPELFYIILAGEVQVLQKSAKLGGDIHDIDGSIAARRHACAITALQEKGELAPVFVPKERIDAGDLGRAVASLGPGCLFGEQGLLDDKPRNATIACSTYCEFLVIEKHDFERVLKTAINAFKMKQLAGPMMSLVKELESPVLTDMDAAAQESMPNVMRYVRMTAGEWCFRQGDPPTRCYILLAGGVDVYREDLDETGKVPNATLGSPEARMVSSAILAKLIDLKVVPSENKLSSSADVESNTDDPELTPMDRIGVQVAALGPGILFGEHALLDDSPQKASVRCWEDAHFLCIDKADFKSAVRKAKRAAQVCLPRVVQPVVDAMPFFQDQDKSVLAALPYVIKYVVEPRGSILYWQGDDPERCYILLSGEVATHKRITTNAHGFGGEKVEIPSEEAQAACWAAASELRSSDKERSKRCRQSVVTRMSESAAMQKVKEDGMTLEMFGIDSGVLEVGSIFGEKALISNTKQVSTTSCFSDCQLLVIEGGDFDKLLREQKLKDSLGKLGGYVRTVLGEFPLFKDVSSAVKDELPSITSFLWKPQGTVLFREGDAGDMCYVILSGEVTVWKTIDKHLERDPEAASCCSSAVSPNVTQSSFARSFARSARKFTYPPVLPVASSIREKCTWFLYAYASLEAVRKQKKQDDDDSAAEVVMDDWLLSSSCKALVSFGAGSIVGETALLKDQPRNATVSCRGPCEFLVMERADFDRLLKSDMKAVFEEKAKFIRDYFPRVRSVPNAMAERVMYSFAKRSFGRGGHVLFRQGQESDGSIYFVWNGSVELHAKDSSLIVKGAPMPSAGVKRLGVLLKGSIFGAEPRGSPCNYSATSTSSPCEVLHLVHEKAKTLPEYLLRSLCELVQQSMTRRNQGPVNGSGLSWGNMARPLSLPTLAATRPAASNAKKGNAKKVTVLPPSPTAATLLPRLFARENVEQDYQKFHMEPGAVLALTGERPKPRRTRRMEGVVSLPRLK